MIRRVLTSVTPAADATLILAMGALFALGGPVFDTLLGLVRVDGLSLVMTSSVELATQRCATRVVLATLPVFTWSVAAFSGTLRRAPSGLLRCGAYAALMAAGMAAAVLLRAHGWRTSLEAAAAGGIRPLVRVSELGFWVTGLEASILAAVLLAVAVAGWHRRRGAPSTSPPGSPATH